MVPVCKPVNCDNIGYQWRILIQSRFEYEYEYENENEYGSEYEFATPGQEKLALLGRNPVQNRYHRIHRSIC